MATPHVDQALESNQNLSRDVLTTTGTCARERAWRNQDAGLYSPRGERKYVTHEERNRVLAAIETLKPEQALFCLLLAWTGARVSELLTLTPSSFALDANV